MIIVRAPLRITLGGGGSDIASFYSKQGGFCIAAAIDKYVYITVHRTFVDDLILKYSQLERVSERDQIQHPIVRAVFESEGIPVRGLEVSSMADIPAGTGLGSSSSFTVALIKALRLHMLHNDWLSFHQFAERACAVEIDMLHSPIGKQDQYIAAYGGIRCMTFGKYGDVLVEPVRMQPATLDQLEDGLTLFFTGYQRSATEVLTSPTVDNDHHLELLKGLAYDTRKALERGDLEQFATMLTEQWRIKRTRMPCSTSAQIDAWFELGIEAGALGGKLVGAGGGGFLLFYGEEKRKLRQAMTSAGLTEVRFKFDNEGARAILQE